MENFRKLKALIESAEQDAVKFYDKGNQVAGTRLRNALQQSKTLAQVIRNEVTTKKNAK